MIGDPPSDAGGVQNTRAAPSNAWATTPFGALGCVCGVTGFESADWGPVPSAFIAATRNV